MQSARLMRQARPDAFGQATLRCSPETEAGWWQTPLARKLLGEYFGIDDDNAPRPCAPDR